MQFPPGGIYHGESIMQGLRALQLEDGSFCATLGGSENDMRFVYCAACICFILQDWSGIDITRATRYIINSVSYDSGIGQGPGLESHGGSTYCAIAALVLMGRFESSFTKKQVENIRRWCLTRQDSGFQGRPNKPVDTCYSFWVGATLKLLGIYDLSDKKENIEYVLTTQDSVAGGLAKWEDVSPDPLHTYLGLGGLSMILTEELNEVHPALNITYRAVAWLHELHTHWRQER